METPSISNMVYASTSTNANKIADFMNQQPGARGVLGMANAQQAINQPKEQKPVSTSRIVKVFIADPDDNLPLESRVLYSGDEKLTDLTDQELFFEIPLAEKLAAHNDKRKLTTDKKASDKFGRDIMLEPARIRDLRMVVVTVAQF